MLKSISWLLPFTSRLLRRDYNNPIVVHTHDL